MKKNIAMRVAALLFILTMISTCAFATTFAKYTTSGSATDTARVAKWGVTVTADAKDYTEYEIGGSDQDAQILLTDDVKILAPGSKVNFAAVHVSGTPEVSVSVTFSATLTLTNWSDGTNPYCPLIFKVVNNDYYIGKNVSTSTIAAVSALGTIDNIAELKAAVEADIANYSQASLNPNTTLSDTLTVSCTWQYEGNIVPSQTDVKDTALGNAAADADTANDPGISLTISCTVTQID